MPLQQPPQSTFSPSWAFGLASMANRFGEIRPHRLFLAVEIGQARRPLGPHGTEFYGITLTATLVERDRLPAFYSGKLHIKR